MSLPKNDRISTVDFSLERTLKNWVGRKEPPLDGKAGLLQSAARQSLPKISIFSMYITLATEHDTELYLYRLKMTDVSSLRLCAFGMC